MLDLEVKLSPFEAREHSVLALLEQGKSFDAFAILGLHKDDELNCWLYRVYLPGANFVSLEYQGRELVFSRFEHSDLFHLQWHNNNIPIDAKLKVEYPGVTTAIYDCYRFPSDLDQQAMYLFCEGTLAHAHRHFGAHLTHNAGVSGIRFTVWAPNACNVSVVGDFNYWNPAVHVMRKHPASGVWELFIPAISDGNNYKFSLLTAAGQRIEKADPFAFAMQKAPETAAVTCTLPCVEPIEQLPVQLHHVDSPISIYEVHIGSWRRKSDGSFLSYTEVAQQLVPYVKSLGFTHIQFMPVSEYPFDGSWGYQPIGLFCPSNRFGSASDFANMVQVIKTAGLGVIADWVPAHFPSDEHGLKTFDGTHLYEHADQRQGFHPDWQTHIFNYDRAEVRSFLLSNATFWLESFGLDGLRVDAVASMLYLDYSRNDGEWVPNCYGGRENLGAISLLQYINHHLYGQNPNIMMVAEESTAWPGVTQMTDSGGLGFGYKWNMGWMNDTLEYMVKDPIHRKYHHHNMTFAMVYAFSENFILPLSHDEVVHGKGSMYNKMPGDSWQKFANLRCYYAFMWSHPGKKLLFMGAEFAQINEWNHQQSLDWHLVEFEQHRQISDLITQLNQVYKTYPALYLDGLKGKGFQWLDSHNAEQSILSFIRLAEGRSPAILTVCNFTPVVYDTVRIGVPFAGEYELVLNTDEQVFGGSGVCPGKTHFTEDVEHNGFSTSIVLKVAPLATYYLKHVVA